VDEGVLEAVRVASCEQVHTRGGLEASRRC
jgi:hypothetical protein